MATNAEAIADALARAGVEFAFGLPGGEVAVLIDACRRAGIRFFLTGHEASAAFMADVTGQISGRPGVCISTLGPGAMNLCLGVANALLDRSPVLALTAQIPSDIAGYFSHQRLLLTRIFGSFCKLSQTVDGRATGELTERCLRLATVPPFGPVHLALPSDLAGQQVILGPLVEVAKDPSEARGGALDEIIGVLNEAERPLLVVGVGCAPQDVPALRRFVDQTGMAYVLTPKAKGALPEDGKGFLGVIGGMALDSLVMKSVDQSDLLLGVGFDPVECDKPWYVDRRVANISRAPTAEGSYKPFENIGDIAAQLDVIGSRARPKPWPADLVAEGKVRVRPKPFTSSRAMSPLATIRALREVLPRETVLTCDVGSHKYYAGQFWETNEPQSFFVSNGLSAMGYGIPAAIAAKLHFPQRPVVALVGDGGLLMMLHNLVFLRQYRIPVVIVVYVDESLSLIRIAQQRRGIEIYGVDFPAPDFAHIARGFGIRGIQVNSLDQLKREVGSVLHAKEPAVISVPIDISEYEAFV